MAVESAIRSSSIVSTGSRPVSGLQRLKSSGPAGSKQLEGELLHDERAAHLLGEGRLRLPVERDLAAPFAALPED